MRGQESRPIWIMVTLLLAMVVGITMYQIIQKTRAQQSFEEMIRDIDAGTAKLRLVDICSRWRETGYLAGVTGDDFEKATAYAVLLNYFTKEEFDAGERISSCDCTIILHAEGRLSKLDARRDYDPDICHERANEIAEAKGFY